VTLAPPGLAVEADDVRRSVRAPGILRAFNDAGVLTAADVHVARRLVELTGPFPADDGAGADAVLLGVALAVRAPRLGHVCVDVGTARRAVSAEVEAETGVDPDALPWPEPDPWLDALAAHAAIATGPGDAGDVPRPLRLAGSRLYLDRYWRLEQRIIDEVRARDGTVPVDRAVLDAGLGRLFPGATPGDLQRRAAEVALTRHLTVIAGGPGTGKTTTVARILALLDEQATDAPLPRPLGPDTPLPRPLGPPRIALAAPTGKAAARLQEAVHGEAARLPLADGTRRRLLGIGAATLHRLLGWRPDSHSRFRHHAGNRLPHDVVVVDEASMVSLSLMAKLMDAVRPDARLVLVGDPDQLASVEAGAVLGDVVGPAAQPMHGELPAVADGIVVLRRVHRFGGQIARLAEAIQAGDADGVMAVLTERSPQAGDEEGVSWIDADLATGTGRGRLDPVRRRVVAAGRLVHEAARAGDARAALDALGAVRVLCAHRHGPYGVAEWMPAVERWLIEAIPGYGAGGRWYVGRPLLVTANDYGLQLYNGDAGVVVSGGGGPRAAFERRGEPVLVSPTRLAAVDTVHAMTVHKSQGSQFGAVAVLLPDGSSPVLSRELLYTAVTRAQDHVTVVGTEPAVRAAVERPVARASGLRAGLWGS
jgi:exodeoxyribonuclease V alpha subunit